MIEGAGATKLKPVVDAVLGLNFLSFDVNDFVLLSVSKLNPEEAEGVKILVFIPKLKLDVDVAEDFGFFFSTFSLEGALLFFTGLSFRLSFVDLFVASGMKENSKPFGFF